MHAGQAQQLGERCLQARKPGGRSQIQLGVVVQHRLVDLRAGALLMAGLEAERQIDLAARDFLADALAQIVFQRPQLFGQPQAELEVAVVDRAHFAADGTESRCWSRSGIGGHASDHGVLSQGMDDEW